MTVAQTEKSTALEPKLTKGDRCDRCGAQAYVCITFDNMSELYFCNHDYKKNETKLREVAMMINDESDRLLNK